MVQAPTVPVHIHISVINGKDCLRFKFNDVLTHKEAIQICAEWELIAKADPTKRYCIIFDALSMINYEPQARIAFQKTIKNVSSQIDMIWVITDSKVIAGGAAIMGIFTSFAIRCVKNESEIR